MSIKWIEGFECLSKSSGSILMAATDLANKYPNSDISGSHCQGRFGKNTITWYADKAKIQTPNLGDDDKWIVGFAKNWTSIVKHVFLEILDDDVVQVSVCLNDNGTISIFCGESLLLTSDWVAKPGVWYYLEFKIVLNNIDGQAEFRVNGKSYGSRFGLDTQVTPNSLANSFILTQVGPSYLDDIYILDGLPDYNDFLAHDADGLVVESIPLIADGHHAEWKSTTPDHYRAVSGLAPRHQDRDYLRSHEPNSKQTFLHGDPIVSQDHVGLQMNIRCTRVNECDRHALAPLHRYLGSDIVRDSVPVRWPAMEHRQLHFIKEVSPEFLQGSELGCVLDPDLEDV